MALLCVASSIFFILGSTTATITTTEIFVDTSTAYDDGASAGTRSSPFDSLETARDAMRNGLGRGTQRVVRVRAGPGGGPVYLARPFALTAEDSATADAGITYAGWATEGTPVQDPVQLEAGTPVPRSAWSSVAVPSGAPHVFVANLTSLGVNASSLGAMANPYPKSKLELFYGADGGAAMTLARDPNIGDDALKTWHWAGYDTVSGLFLGSEVACSSLSLVLT